MEIIKIAAVILVCTMLIASMPAMDKAVVSLVSVTVTILVIAYIVSQVEPVISDITKITMQYESNNFILLYKVLGISLLTQFVSDIAADMGNKALSNQMLFAGRRAIIVLAMPVFTEVLEIIGKLLE